MRIRFLPVSMLASALLMTGCQMAGHSGRVIALGEQDLNGMNIEASRDEGEIIPGGDAPIDIWIDGGLGNAERFASGSERKMERIRSRLRPK